MLKKFDEFIDSILENDSNLYEKFQLESPYNFNREGLNEAAFDGNWYKSTMGYGNLILNKLKDEGKLVFIINPNTSAKNHKRVTVDILRDSNIENLISALESGDLLKADKILRGGAENEKYQYIFKDAKSSKTYRFTQIYKGQFSGHDNVTKHTDIKEGMVVYFYYNDHYNNAEEVLDNLEVAENAINSIPKSSLNKKVRDKLISWIKNLENNYNIRDKLNTYISSAKVLPKGLKIDRNEVYDEIRKIGATLSKLAPDNWNPGDFYMYNEGLEPKILKFIREAKDSLALKTLFAKNFDELNTDDILNSILSISLKEGEARAGKAKQYMKMRIPDESYNVSSKEKNNIESGAPEYKWAWQKIQDMSTTLQSLINNINREKNVSAYYYGGNLEEMKKTAYEESKTTIETWVKQKYAALKLILNFINTSNDITKLLREIYLFGAKIHDITINPSYIKVTGDKKGKGKVEFFDAGDTIYILLEDGGIRNTHFVVNNGSERQNIAIFFYVYRNNKAYEVRLDIGGGGNEQAKMEFQTPNIITDYEKHNSQMVDKIIVNYIKKRKQGIIGKI